MQSPELNGRLGRLGRLILKELREILRDRRTIVTLLVMPLLLYPVLSVAFQQFFLSQIKPVGPPAYTLAFRNQQEGNYLSFVLNQGGLLLTGITPPASPATGGDPSQAEFHPTVVENIEEAVRAGGVDAALRIVGDYRPHFDPSRDLAVDLELLYREDLPASRDVAALVEKHLGQAGNQFLESRLSRIQVSQRTFPLKTQRRSLSETEAAAGIVSLTAVIPLILTLMTVTGAVYPAIDLTAGERERGTLEILVAAPIPRIGVLFAKYIAVVVVAMLTAAANLLMMTLTIQSSKLGQRLFGDAAISFPVIAAVFALLLLFAAFYSAVLLVVTSTARSFKEAQAYLIPLMLLSLAPGLLCLMPNVELTGLLQVVPLANIVLLGRDLLTMKATGSAVLAVVASTALYSAAAIGVAARIFGAESVLYSTSAGWGDLFLRPRTVQPAPSLTAGVVTVAVICPLFFLLQSLGGWFSDLQTQLTIGAAVTVVAFGLIPWAVCVLRRVSVSAWYSLSGSPRIWIAAAILGLSLWGLDHELVVRIAQARGVDFTALLKRLADYATGLRSVSPILVVLLIGVIPAVFEEFFFRGYLWSAVEHQKGHTTALLVTSVTFGVFHLLMPNPLAIERLAATTAMGFVLGWVRMNCGSVWPGTLLHALHNTTAVLISYYAASLQQVGLGQTQGEHLPRPWLFTSLAAAVTGLVAITRSRPRAQGGND